ncbi:MAG: type 1 glutamine amidotransferase [Solirubrobacteraceae bacterium]
MNIYADRGNLLMLERRCAWRGIGFSLSSSTIGEELDGSAHEIYYLGGGQDADQLLCAEDLVARKRLGLSQAAARGAIVLGVCGGFQLLGRSYQLDEQTIAGVGLLGAHTVRGTGDRLIGNVAIETPIGVLAGFENHGGRTYLDSDQQPLGRVLRGHGNDARSGWEGAMRGSVIGTYLHGPLLPKNAWFADWLIAEALGADSLAPLDDALEDAAHAGARAAAGI